MTNQEEYIKQLEETNRQLQEKLEESEKKHDEFLDRKIYIYMDAESRFVENISFDDKNGAYGGAIRIITNTHFIQKSYQPHVNHEDRYREQIWKNGVGWVNLGLPNINLNSMRKYVASITSTPRTIKVNYSKSSLDDLNRQFSLGGVDVGKQLQEDVEKSIGPIIKSFAKKGVKVKKNAKRKK